MEESVTNSLIGYLQEKLSLDQVDVRTFSPLALAFIGDSIYDLVIRTMMIEQGNAPVQVLHRKVSGIVNAKVQKKMMLELEPFLSEEEGLVYRRGYNAKFHTAAPHATIEEYRTATGLEALFGYLYLSGKMDRLLELTKIGLTKIDAWPKKS